jgi:hypothetical protein
MGSYRSKQRVLGLTRIQSRVLHHNGHIRLNQTRIRRVGRDLFRILKIIEAQMLVTPSGNREFVGTNRITIFKKDCDSHVRVLP